MKFGIMLPHYRHVASTEAITRLGKEAEDMGYDSVWVTDLIIVPKDFVDRFGSVFYESLTVLAFVAGITSTIRLGSSVIVLPYRNPIHLAKVASTIDSLSHGRLILGVGIGGAESQPTENASTLVKRADVALYTSKSAGRNVGHWHDGKLLIPLTPVGSNRAPVFGASAVETTARTENKDFGTVCNELRQRLVAFASEKH